MRETLDFSARCQSTGHKKGERLSQHGSACQFACPSLEQVHAPSLAWSVPSSETACYPRLLLVLI